MINDKLICLFFLFKFILVKFIYSSSAFVSAATLPSKSAIWWVSLHRSSSLAFIIACWRLRSSSLADKEASIFARLSRRKAISSLIAIIVEFSDSMVCRSLIMYSSDVISPLIGYGPLPDAWPPSWRSRRKNGARSSCRVHCA